MVQRINSAGAAAGASRRPRVVSRWNQTSFLTLLWAQKVIPVSAAVMALTADSIITTDNTITNIKIKCYSKMSIRIFMLTISMNWFEPMWIWFHDVVYLTYPVLVFRWELGVTGRCKGSSVFGCDRGVDFLVTFGMLVIIYHKQIRIWAKHVILVFWICVNLKLKLTK